MAYGEYGVDGGGLDYGINGQLLVFRSCTVGLISSGCWALSRLSPVLFITFIERCSRHS